MSLDAEREACLRLGLADGFGPVGHRLLSGPLGFEATLNLPDHQLGRWRHAVEEARELSLEGLDLEHILTLADPDYPRLLRETPSPPLVLWWAGRRPDPVRDRAAIVGTRRATDYGRRMSAEIARDLSKAGVEVVSGLALGIDGAAHRGALEGGAGTIAVLACGIDRLFPDLHRGLAREILADGTLLTEFKPGTPALRGNFPRRNRIISGLATAVILVESRRKGGTLHTANFASQQNRSIYAIPGDVGRLSSEGTNRLIHQMQAHLILSADDVLKDSFPALCSKRPREESVREGLLQHLEAEPRSVDRICHDSGRPAEKVLVELLHLELAGEVRQYPGRRFGLM